MYQLFEFLFPETLRTDSQSRSGSAHHVTGWQHRSYGMVPKARTCSCPRPRHTGL